MNDEERSQVFDAHEALRKTWTRWKMDHSAQALAELEQVLADIQRLDAQLLANMARQLGKTKSDDPETERYWWQRQ